MRPDKVEIPRIDEGEEVVDTGVLVVVEVGAEVLSGVGVWVGVGVGV